MTSSEALPIPEASLRALTPTSSPANYSATAWAREVATPVVVAELLALADRLSALSASAGARYREGFDAAVGEVRELIADRCDELGTRVEEL